MKKNEMEKVFNKLSLEVRSTGHNYGWLVVKGKKVLSVHYSHGRGDITEKVVNKIRGQLKLAQRDFKNLVGCPLTYDNYIDILKQKGLLG